MIAATLSNVADSRLGPNGRRIVVDCPHGTTRGWLGGDDPHPVSIDSIIQLLLAHHLEEQPTCRCIRDLWQQHFDAPLGQIILALGVS